MKLKKRVRLKGTWLRLDPKKKAGAITPAQKTSKSSPLQSNPDGAPEQLKLGRGRLSDDELREWMIRLLPKSPLKSNGTRAAKHWIQFWEQDFRKTFGGELEELVTQDQFERVQGSEAVENAKANIEYQHEVTLLVNHFVWDAIWEGQTEEAAWARFKEQEFKPEQQAEGERQSRPYFSKVWAGLLIRINHRKERERLAAEEAERLQFAQLERVERHRLHRLEEEARAREALALAEHRQAEERKAHAAEREAQANARRIAAEERQAAREEARRAAWAEAHPEQVRPQNGRSPS